MGKACSTYGGEKRLIQGFSGAKPEGRNHLEDPGLDGCIILKWILEKWDRRAWIWLRIGTGGGL